MQKIGTLFVFSRIYVCFASESLWGCFWWNIGGVQLASEVRDFIIYFVSEK